MDLDFFNDTLWLDASGFKVVCLTCKKWYTIAATVAIWEKIVPRYMEGIGAKAKQFLFSEKELERIVSKDKGRPARQKPNKKDYRLTALQNTYKICATALIVVQTTDEQMLATFQQDLTEGTSHHTILRKKRVYGKIRDAIEASMPGDYIFLTNCFNKGQFEEELTITKPVHIFGTLGQRIEHGEAVNLLLTSLTKPITWDCGPEKCGSLTSCYLPGSAKITIKNSRIKMHRLVFTGKSHVHVIDHGELKMWRCTMDRCKPCMKIDPTFNSVDILDTTFGDDDFEVSELVQILSRLDSSISAPPQNLPPEKLEKYIRGLVNSVGVIAKIKNGQIRKCLMDMNVAEILKKVLEKYKTVENVLLAVVRTVNKILLSDETALVTILATLNMIPYLDEMIVTHSENEELQEWIPICLWNLVNQARSRYQFQEKQIYFRLLNNLEIHAKSLPVVFEIVSFFWHSAHHLPPTRAFLIENLPKLVKVLEFHKNSEKLHREVMGLIWNLPSNWAAGVTKTVLPHILHTFSLTTTYSSVNTTLGGFLIVTRRCPKEEIDFLVEKNVVQILMEVKGRSYVESEAENRLWKAITLIARNANAQKVLADLLVKDYIWPPLSEKDKFKIARALTIHETVDPRTFSILRSLIEGTKHYDTFFIGLDAVVHLSINKHLIAEKEQIKNLGELVLARAEKFLEYPRITTWLGWARHHITGEPLAYKFRMDPAKSAMMHVASNGYLCRHEFSGAFGTAIASHAVSKGAWYYEVEPLTSDLFHIGWVVDEFVPDPTEGIGVGDSEYSWGVDLKKHTKWHLSKDGTVRLPYGLGVKMELGGIVQCYLDLDNRVMSFGYNGEHLGSAYEGFDIGKVGMYAAVSTNLENECRLNFGEEPFSCDGAHSHLYCHPSDSKSGGHLTQIQLG